MIKFIIELRMLSSSCLQRNPHHNQQKIRDLRLEDIVVCIPPQLGLLCFHESVECCRSEMNAFNSIEIMCKLPGPKTPFMVLAV